MLPRRLNLIESTKFNIMKIFSLFFASSIKLCFWTLESVKLQANFKSIGIFDNYNKENKYL